MPIFFILIWLLICPNISSYGQSSFITGKIYSQVNLSPLEDAKIVLKKDNKYYGKTQTDHVGNYWFGNLKSGKYTLWIVQDGFCQLEMDEIVVSEQTSIHLDLGLMENAANTNVISDSKVYLIYQEPIIINFDEGTTAYQDFKNEIHIINEVYEGSEMRIAPKIREPSPIDENRRTSSFQDFLRGLENTKPLVPGI